MLDAKSSRAETGLQLPPRALGLSALPEARTRLTDLDRLASSYDPSVHLLRR
jgi:hypothetical protein